MVDERIREIRDLLNHLSNLENLNDSQILGISQELDKLILEYYHFKFV